MPACAWSGLQVVLGHRSIEGDKKYAQLTDKTREEEYFTAHVQDREGEQE